MKGAFVTATGTDVGKTFVMAGLIGALRRVGCPVAALKPVATGFNPEILGQSDSAVLLTALGRPATPAGIAAISPWRFRAPLSPDMAARRDGREIDFDSLVAFCRASADEEDLVLIEGVGGVMVPLDDRHTVLDWMAALSLPIALVAGTYLGTISHTLTAIDVLIQHRLRVAALFISETQGSSVPLGETAETIARFQPGIEIIALPRWVGSAERDRGFDRAAAPFLQALAIT